MKIENSIDIVITWVDGNDPEWRSEKNKTRYGKEQLSETDDREERFRDWENLRYWFRGIENCASWVRKIHFVTWGHIPEWLNTKHPKLNIVRHTDYIPPEFLPTFNSHTIEWNMHRIQGLSEQFVYFNDDMFLLKRTDETDFFRNGRPVDMLALQPDVANVDNPVMPYIYLNNAMVLARYFDKYKNMKQQPGAYFHFGYPLKYFVYNMLEMAFPRYTGFYTVHGPSPLRKDTFEKLWELEPELLTKVCGHSFRHKEDISQYVLREYQKLSGEFIPKNVEKTCRYYELATNNDKLYRTVAERREKIICINDANCEIDFDKIKRELNNAFEIAFPEKSAYENF